MHVSSPTSTLSCGTYSNYAVLYSANYPGSGATASTVGTLGFNVWRSSPTGVWEKLHIGAQGEANIIFSNSLNSNRIGHVMFVRQNGGPSLFADQTITGDGIQVNSVTDPLGDGVREFDGMTSANLANLDIISSTVTKPNASLCHPAGTPCYRVQMKLNNLTTTPPPAVAPDQNLVWLTQWITPSQPACVSGAAGCANGGRNFHVYAESDPGFGLRCFFGEVSIQAVGGGVTLTYPPAFLSGQIMAPGACAIATGSNGTVTIEVPIGSVSLEAVAQGRYWLQWVRADGTKAWYGPART